METPLTLVISSGGHCSGRYASYWNSVHRRGVHPHPPRQTPPPPRWSLQRAIRILLECILVEKYFSELRWKRNIPRRIPGSATHYLRTQIASFFTDWEPSHKLETNMGASGERKWIRPDLPSKCTYQMNKTKESDSPHRHLKWCVQYSFIAFLGPLTLNINDWFGASASMLASCLISWHCKPFLEQLTLFIFNLNR